MTTYLVFGCGFMGEVICHDLLKFDPTAKVIGIEVDASRIKNLEEKFKGKNIEFHNETLSESNDNIRSLFKTADVAFGAIDYRFNELLTKLAIESKTHFLDLGGNPSVVANQKKMDHQAKNNSCTVIPDCGLAPGMVNVLAADAIKSFQEPHECHIRVGGLPQKPKGILKYQQVFSIRGLTNEYIEDAIIIRDNKITKVKSLTEVEELSFSQPFEDLEAFHTAGGTSSLPSIFEGKINQLTYKTIRYKGHVQFFQFLDELGLLSDDPFPLQPDINPRQVIEYYLQKQLPKNDPDIVLARIFVSGIKDGKFQRLTMDLIDYETDGYTSMARTTAFPVSIIGQMIAKGAITARGVVPGELVIPYEQFKIELARRDITFTEKFEE